MKIINSNVVRILSWMVSLAALTWAILTVFEKNYNRYVVDQDSCSVYRVGIFSMVAATVFLSLVWWVIAVGRCKVKEHMENRTQKWVIGFIIACFIVAGIIFIIFPGIKMKSGTPKYVTYVFSYPCIFGFNLFFASPNNIYKVIFPYSKWKNLLASVVFVIISIMIVCAGGI